MEAGRWSGLSFGLRGLQCGRFGRGGGHLCQRRLLESGRVEHFVRDGGAAGDGGTQQGVQVRAAAEDGGGVGGRRRGGWRRGRAGVRQG